MHKIILTLAIALLIYTTFGFAIEVTNINNANTQMDQIAQINTINANIQTLQNKMNTFATKDDISSLLLAHLQKTDELLSAFKSMLIIGEIIVGFCLIGLAFGIFFYFKSRGRV
jgi:hypothetical protein